MRGSYPTRCTPVVWAGHGFMAICATASTVSAQCGLGPTCHFCHGSLPPRRNSPRACASTACQPPVRRGGTGSRPHALCTRTAGSVDVHTHPLPEPRTRLGTPPRGCRTVMGKQTAAGCCRRVSQCMLIQLVPGLDGPPAIRSRRYLARLSWAHGYKRDDPLLRPHTGVDLRVVRDCPDPQTTAVCSIAKLLPVRAAAASATRWTSPQGM
jgi:hypothetical protein